MYSILFKVTTFNKDQLKLTKIKPFFQILSDSKIRYCQPLANSAVKTFISFKSIDRSTPLLCFSSVFSLNVPHYRTDKLIPRHTSITCRSMSLTV